MIKKLELVSIVSVTFERQYERKWRSLYAHRCGNRIVARAGSAAPSIGLQPERDVSSSSFPEGMERNKSQPSSRTSCLCCDRLHPVQGRVQDDRTAQR